MTIEGFTTQQRMQMTPPAFSKQADYSQSQRYALTQKPFDSFQQASLTPTAPPAQSNSILNQLKHPFFSFYGKKLLIPANDNSKETYAERLAMFQTLQNTLDRKTVRQLNALLRSGTLTETRSENHHSTLYHLYSMLQSPRARNLESKKVVSETINMLNRPYAISQKFADLTEDNVSRMLRTRNNPMGELNRTGTLPATEPLTWSDINVKNSATCVSSSVMYYMAEKEPAELARHLNELTSPMQAFYETSKLKEISPNNPQDAFQVLDDAKIKYQHKPNSDEVVIKVELPLSGLIRTANAEVRNGEDGARSGIQAAYQSALSFMATRRTYDPATDMRDSETPGTQSKGLTEQEKTLMETIVKHNGGVQSVTYQIAAGKDNPTPEEEGVPFLFGYTQDFDDTANDIIDALNMNEFVIIGITDTDQGGEIVGGHEITITSAFVDKAGEVQFTVVDSDDDINTPVTRTAKELIPRIHHAGLPIKLAQRIQGRMDKAEGYLVPNEADKKHYTSLDISKELAPASALGLPTTEQELSEANTPISVNDNSPTPNNVIAIQQFTPSQPAQPFNQQQLAANTYPPTAYFPQAQQYINRFQQTFTPTAQQPFIQPQVAAYPQQPTLFRQQQVPSTSSANYTPANYPQQHIQYGYGA